jgi:hypothetical protein
MIQPNGGSSLAFDHFSLDQLEAVAGKAGTVRA